MTTRIALIGDVHANLPALETVLADAQKRGAERIWNIGDFVGYGPFPEQVVTLLRQDKRVVSIAGNYDLKVLDPNRKKPSTPEKETAFAWAYEQLSPANRRYLRSLPTSRRLRTGGRRVLLCHGSPDSVDEHLTPDTDPQRLAELARKAKADIVVFGHSHVPFARKVEGVWMINTGSVGRPDDGNPAACYAMLSLDEQSVRVKHHRLAYDLERTVAEIRRHHLPERFAQMLIRGRSFNEVEKELQAQPTQPPPARAGAPKKPAWPRKRSAAGRPTKLAENPVEVSQHAPPPGGKGLHIATAPSASTDIVSASALREAARQLTDRSGTDWAHTSCVTKLALCLFDQLAGLHGLGDRQRLLLEAAATLHDIGWIHGQKGHHKNSMRMILESQDLPLEGPSREVVACVARYHRKALPSKAHQPYASMTKDDRHLVRVLAGILRVADGLDQTHHQLVKELRVSVTPQTITLSIATTGPSSREDQDVHAKAELIEKTFGRRLFLKWRLK